MAAYLIDFELHLYQSRLVGNVETAQEAKEFAEKLLDDDGFWYALCDDYRDHLKTDWLRENVEPQVYGGVPVDPQEWDHYERIDKE